VLQRCDAVRRTRRLELPVDIGRIELPISAANWFIALSVPTEAWWHRVSAPPDGVRLFAPDDVHLTVAFLGPVGVEAAEAAFELAPEWPAPPLDVTLGDLKPMGNTRRPSSLSSIVTDGAEAVAEAMLEVRDAMCDRAGARHEDRPPLPHVTLARVGRRASREQQRAAVAWARSLDLARPRVTLSNLVLFTRAEDRSVRLFREHASYLRS
jgi:2'-5' RNA ligase